MMTAYRYTGTFLVFLALSTSPVTSLMEPRPSLKSSGTSDLTTTTTTRRGAIASLAGWLSLGSSLPSYAFSNKISTQYDDRPKRRGPKPPDLGVATRKTLEGDDYVGLKACGASPNCFSSTIPVDDDPDHSIPAWSWPKDMDQSTAMAQLKQVLESYPPGQAGIDGGGFQIQTINPNYIYVQYESLKNGFIDDVEFAILDGSSSAERTVQVRSSSRIGYLDYGVNAKRLNWIANAMRDKGWNAPGVDFKTHLFYASENQVG